MNKIGVARRNLYTTAVAGLGLAALALCLLGLVRNLPALWPHPQPADLGDYYAAATILNRGSAAELYNRAMQDQIARSVGLPGVANGYVYLPFLAVLLRPLALLPFEMAAILWLAANLLALAVSVWLLLDLAALPRTPFTFVGACAFSLLLPPVTSSLVYGQVNILLLALLAGAWHCLRDAGRRDGRAGLLLGLSVALKLYPGVLILPLMARGRWRAVGGALAGLALALGIGIVGGGGTATTWQFLVGVLPHVPAPAVPTNQSLLAAVSRLLAAQQYSFSVLSAANQLTMTTRPLVEAPAAILPVTALLSLASVGVTVGVLAAARRREHPLVLDLSLALLMVLCLLPLAWEHYYSLLLLPWAALWGLTPRRRATLLLLLGSTLALAAQRYDRLLAASGVPFWLLSFSLAATAAAWGYVLYVISRERLIPDEAQDRSI